MLLEKEGTITLHHPCFLTLSFQFSQRDLSSYIIWCIVYSSEALYCCSILVCWSIHYSLTLCDLFPAPPIPSVSNYNFDKSKQCIGAMTIEIDFLQKKSTDSSPYDSDRMAAEFIQQFNNQAFSVTQQVFTCTHVPGFIFWWLMLPVF